VDVPLLALPRPAPPLMLGTQDPIRNALRDLVRQRRIWAWNARPTHHGTDEWTVVTTEHRATLYTTDAVNKLIAMHWHEET
jgi:hypothetical protein